MQDIDWTLALMWYVAFLYSTVFHEAAHAWSAYKLGDDTAYRGGQVSLDPIPHIRREPFGMVIVPILSFILGGWMIGWASAPYDPRWALQHPRRSAWMALAGPAANLVILLAASLLIRVGMEWNIFEEPLSHRSFRITSATQDGGVFEFCAMLLSVVWSLNLLLFVFNLLPLPPLDGSSLPLLFLNARTAESYIETMSHPTWRFFGIFVAWNAFGRIYPPIREWAVNALYGGFF